MIFMLSSPKETVVIRADDEQAARRWVAEEAEDERWRDANYARCDMVEPEGETKVIGWFDDDKMR